MSATIDPENLLAAIRHRRSLGVARLSPDPIEPSRILACLDAANWAPSHGETEPWRFVVFTGDSRNALGDAFARAYELDTPAESFKEATFQAQKARAFSAPVWIALGLQPGRRDDGSLKMGPDEEMMAVACAAQNLHLMASAQNLAGMWLSKNPFVHESVASWLGWESPARLLGFFALGNPTIPWPAGERRPLAEKIRWAEPSMADSFPSFHPRP